MTTMNDELVAMLSEGMSGLQRAALQRSIEHPEAMDRDTYLSIQKIDENMDLAVAKGEDCAAGFEDLRKHVFALIEAAPWVMHPDHGCIHPSEIEDIEVIGDANGVA